MRDIQATFTERYLKIQVSAEPPRQRPAAAADSDAAARRPTICSPGRPGPAPAAGWAAAPGGHLARPAGALVRAAVPPVGRNDPCPCGSGKKYKKCHGAGM